MFTWPNTLEAAILSVPELVLDSAVDEAKKPYNFTVDATPSNQDVVMFTDALGLGAPCMSETLMFDWLTLTVIVLSDKACVAGARRPKCTT